MKDVRPISDKIYKVPIEDLHVRYIPIVTPLDVWGYPPDMNIIESPHHWLMALLLKKGLCDELRKTDYAKERRYRQTIGMERWTEEHVWKHIKKRYKLLKSIKRRGLLKKYPIELLRKPFWESRFGLRRPWLRGPEIWTGAGRAAAACALGYSHVYARWYEDTMPGTRDRGKFDNKLMFVEGVWQETDRLCRG